MVNALRLFLSRISWLGLLSIDGEKLVAYTIMGQELATSVCDAGFEAFPALRFPTHQSILKHRLQDARAIQVIA